MLNIWFIEEQSNIIATMMMKQVDDYTGRIENVCCDANYRGKGINSKLLNEVIKYSREIGLTKLKVGTYEKLQSAIKFYEKNGFIEQKELRNPEKKSVYFELEL